MGNWCINVMSQSESRLESWVDMECACWGTWASGDCQCHVSHRIYHVAETRLLAWKQNMRCIWTARMLISGHVPSIHVHFRACPCMILVKPCSWLGVDLYWGWFDVPMRTCALNSAQALVSAACMLHEQHLRTMFRQHPMHCWKNVFCIKIHFLPSLPVAPWMPTKRKRSPSCWMVLWWPPAKPSWSTLQKSTSCTPAFWSVRTLGCMKGTEGAWGSTWDTWRSWWSRSLPWAGWRVHMVPGFASSWTQALHRRPQGMVTFCNVLEFLMSTIGMDIHTHIYI